MTTQKAEPLKCDDCVPVTVLNFARAETDLMFSSFVKMREFRLFSGKRTGALPRTPRI
jgi:hypothetical protein